MNWSLIVTSIPAVGALLGVIVLFLKSPAESKQLKANAESAIIDAATRFGVATGDDLDKLRQQFSILEDRYRQLGTLIEEHRDWDREVVFMARQQGLTLPNPPPLHLPKLA